MRATVATLTTAALSLWAGAPFARAWQSVGVGSGGQLLRRRPRAALGLGSSHGRQLLSRPRAASRTMAAAAVAAASSDAVLPQLGLLLVDFDGTLTEKDTIGHLVESTLAARGRRGGGGGGVEETRQAWDDLTEYYVTNSERIFEETMAKAATAEGAADKDALLASFVGALSEFGEPGTGGVASTTTPASAAPAVRSLLHQAPPPPPPATPATPATPAAPTTPPEDDCVQRVSDAKILAMATPDELQESGRDISPACMREGAAEALRAAAAAGTPATIVSINWSQDLLRSVLGAADATISSEEGMFHCNDMEMAEATEAETEAGGGGLRSTGTIVVNIRGAAGKLELTRRLMGERLPVDDGAGGRKACVFVGDSVTGARDPHAHHLPATCRLPHYPAPPATFPHFTACPCPSSSLTPQNPPRPPIRLPVDGRERHWGSNGGLEERTRGGAARWRRGAPAAEFGGRTSARGPGGARARRGGGPRAAATNLRWRLAAGRRAAGDHAVAPGAIARSSRAAGVAKKMYLARARPTAHYI